MRVKTIYYRIYQMAMKVGNHLMGYRMPEYIEGVGSVRRLPELIQSENIDNVLVVTDDGLVKLGLPDIMLRELERSGIAYTLYSNIEPNPTDEDVEDGLSVYKSNGCRAIVAFGGGAPIDFSKAIGARVARPDRTVEQLQGLLRVRRAIPPLFAIPTTAGTGSETTIAAVITDADTHHKASINDTVLIPHFAVFDPELTVGLPPSVTATTGMDALCHAVEAYTNHTYCTKLENSLAIEAVRLIHDNLLTAYHDGGNLPARQCMQKAAFFAGRAFTRGCVGYVHAVGHTLGGLYEVRHGLAMAIILPYVLRQYGTAVYSRLAVLADACGMSGGNVEQKAFRFIDWIERLKEEMNIPVGLDMIKDEDVDQIIRWAMGEANPLYPVPVIWYEEDFRKLLSSIKSP